MRLPECNVEPTSFGLQYPRDFVHVLLDIRSDLIRRVPRYAVNHCIQSSLLVLAIYMMVREGPKTSTLSIAISKEESSSFIFRTSSTRHSRYGCLACMYLITVSEKSTDSCSV